MSRISQIGLENTTIMCAKCMRRVDNLTIDYDASMMQYVFAAACHGSHDICRIDADVIPDTGYLGIAFANEHTPKAKTAIEPPPKQIEKPTEAV